ncbi:hypothetical protein E1178_18075 [Roseibium hamelinense]|nr:hypothetical protein [Roseibium hamelinense]MTI45515.1 hypothetical protein [Roseibium hamelinense]
MRRFLSVFLLVLLTAVHTAPAVSAGLQHSILVSATTSFAQANAHSTAMTFPDGGQNISAHSCCDETVDMSAYLGAGHCASDCLSLLPVVAGIHPQAPPSPESKRGLRMSSDLPFASDHPPKRF